MRIDIDLTDDRIVSSPGVRDAIRLLQFKRDTDGELAVRFWDSGVQVALAGDAVGFFGIKPAGEFDGALLVYANEWTKTGTGATTVYTFTPAFNGVALTDLLGSGDEDVENDETSILAMLEIKWIADGKKHRTQTVDTRIYNDVLKDLDGLPSAFPVLWAAPLALTTVPLDGVGIPNFLETSFAGANNDLRFTQVGTGTAPTIRFYMDNSGADSVSVAGTEISVHLRQNIGAYYMTASHIKTLMESSAAAMALITVAFKAGDNGSGAICQPVTINIAFGPVALAGGSYSPGTVAAALGQLAIVTHSDGTFTEWGCVKVLPPQWLPRTAGILWDETEGKWIRLNRLAGVLDYTVLPDQ
jgi:hypothetical protein